LISIFGAVSSRVEFFLGFYFLHLSDAADRIMAYGTKCFPYPSMLLVRAHYNFAYSDNHALGLNMCSRSEQRSPSLDEQFTLFYYRKMNEVSFTSGDANTDVITYLKFQHTMNTARKYDELCSRWQVTYLFFQIIVS
jgi:hypothetical protein